jgi:hypothetical protein
MLELINKQVSPDMRAINYKLLLYIFDSQEKFRNEFNNEIRPKIDSLKTGYVHFSLVRAFYFILPLATKIAKYVQESLGSKGILLPSVKEVDLDEFSKEILKRYLEEENE